MRPPFLPHPDHPSRSTHRKMAAKVAFIILWTLSTAVAGGLVLGWLWRLM